jgi:hypothetical protein
MRTASPSASATSACWGISDSASLRGPHALGGMRRGRNVRRLKHLPLRAVQGSQQRRREVRLRGPGPQPTQVGFAWCVGANSIRQPSCCEWKFLSRSAVCNEAIPFTVAEIASLAMTQDSLCHCEERCLRRSNPPHRIGDCFAGKRSQ